MNISFISYFRLSTWHSHFWPSWTCSTHFVYRLMAIIIEKCELLCVGLKCRNIDVHKVREGIVGKKDYKNDHDCWDWRGGWICRSDLRNSHLALTENDVHRNIITTTKRCRAGCGTNVSQGSTFSGTAIRSMHLPRLYATRDNIILYFDDTYYIQLVWKSNLITTIESTPYYGNVCEKIRHKIAA